MIALATKLLFLGNGVNIGWSSCSITSHPKSSSSSKKPIGFQLNASRFKCQLLA
jgi:hypothetical protein